MSPRALSIRTIPDHARRRLDEGRLEAYRVISEIAHGGSAVVYLAEQRATGRRVAIKALDPSFIGHSERVHRLLGEHQLAQRARHPGLLDILVADQTADGIPYLVMEYLDGECLSALIERSRLPTAAIVALGGQIAAALAALHAAGVVHCDVKPDNVFVVYAPGPAGWPRVKVIDYGVARLIDDPALPDGAVVGTPAFMAPEQWRGAPIAKSDVYALGSLLYELVTGEPLFSGALPQLMVAHCERLPTRPSALCADVDPALERVILRALAKDPAQRPSMVELEAELAWLDARSARAVARTSAIRLAVDVPLDATA